MLIRPALADDAPAITALLDGAFGQAAESWLVADLRAAGAVVAEVVAQDREGRILGHALLSRLVAPSGWLVLAPVAAAPAPGHRRQGIGSAVVRACLAAGRAAADARAVLVVGDPRFYARFGFSQAAAAGLKCPYPVECTSLLRLTEAALTAAEMPTHVEFPAAFEGI